MQPPSSEHSHLVVRGGPHLLCHPWVQKAPGALERQTPVPVTERVQRLLGCPPAHIRPDPGGRQVHCRPGPGRGQRINLGTLRARAREQPVPGGHGPGAAASAPRGHIAPTGRGWHEELELDCGQPASGCSASTPVHSWTSWKAVQGGPWSPINGLWSAGAGGPRSSSSPVRATPRDLL